MWPYYVYELIDPRTGAVFYVGKGQGKRMDEHEKEAVKGRISRKCERIREIQSLGLQVVKQVVRRFKDEDVAYRFEARRIKKIGIQNLTNVMDGGRVGRAVNGAEDPDKTWVDLIAFFARRTGGFTRSVMVTWCGQTMEFSVEMHRGLLKRLDDLIQRRGVEWATKALAKRRVALSVQQPALSQ